MRRLPDGLMRRALPVILAAGALAGAVQSQAVAQQPPPVAAPKKFYWDKRPDQCFQPGAAESAMCAAEPNWPDYRQTVGRVTNLFVEPDFDLIQRAEDELGYSRQKFPTGEYYFEAWYFSLENNFSFFPSNYRRKTASDWAKSKGSDGYVKLVEAMLHYAEAWLARGRGQANTVAPEAWDLYNEKLDQALRDLDSASPKLKQTGPWHDVKLRIMFQGANYRNMRLEAFKSAIDAWPDYATIYVTAMKYNLPRWGGSFELVEGIARFAAEKNGPELGAAVYAIAYERLLRGDGEYTLRDSQADWDLMKRGFRVLEDKGGAQVSLWKNFAKFACDMRDRDEARRLYAVSDRVMPPTGTEAPDPCRRFAMSSE